MTVKCIFNSPTIVKTLVTQYSQSHIFMPTRAKIHWQKNKCFCQCILASRCDKYKIPIMYNPYWGFILARSCRGQQPLAMFCFLFRRKIGFNTKEAGAGQAGAGAGLYGHGMFVFINND